MNIRFMLCRSEEMEKLLTDKSSYGILHYAKRPDYTFQSLEYETTLKRAETLMSPVRVRTFS